MYDHNLRSYKGIPYDDELDEVCIERFHELRDRVMKCADMGTHPLSDLCKKILLLMPKVEAELHDSIIDNHVKTSSTLGGVGT